MRVNACQKRPVLFGDKPTAFLQAMARHKVENAARNVGLNLEDAQTFGRPVPRKVVESASHNPSARAGFAAPDACFDVVERGVAHDIGQILVYGLGTRREDLAADIDRAGAARGLPRA